MAPSWNYWSYDYGFQAFSTAGSKERSMSFCLNEGSTGVHFTDCSGFRRYLTRLSLCYMPGAPSIQ